MPFDPLRTGFDRLSANGLDQNFLGWSSDSVIAAKVAYGQWRSAPEKVLILARGADGDRLSMVLAANKPGRAADDRDAATGQTSYL